MLIMHRLLNAEILAPGASSFVHAWGATVAGNNEEYQHNTTNPFPFASNRLPAPRAGNLRNFIANITQSLCANDSFVRLYVNGGVVASITVGAGVVGALFSSGPWPVARGDAVSIGYDASTGGGVGVAFAACVELY
jgi:hypothetical protein